MDVEQILRLAFLIIAIAPGLIALWLRKRGRRIEDHPVMNWLVWLFFGWFFAAILWAWADKLFR